MERNEMFPLSSVTQQHLHPAIYQLGHTIEGGEDGHPCVPFPGLYHPGAAVLCRECEPAMVTEPRGLAELDDERELREKMGDLQLVQPGQEQRDLMDGNRKETSEGSQRRRARSLPVEQCPALGAMDGEDSSLLCCCKLKKKVQFADSLGLCLASVKHFLPSEEPSVPSAVLARLQSYPPTVLGQRDVGTEQEPNTPVPDDELRARVEEQGVCLEQALDTQWGIRGCVLVSEPRNDVQVKVRYTFNDWLSYLDCPASTGQFVVPGTQRFLFTLCYPPTTRRIQFAICCNTGNGQELWDNNQGDNYTVCCHQDPLQDFQASETEQEECDPLQHW
ncbi:hypothetical protein GDO86_011278 [Hymenochirus boettgeri]|uniref:CBM21 domain-containing protein n=1 Tax=Hymenochirus boettgeri TaxID=247094 RepID=A0A8T2JG05_9PIPI|nr:hypothetical protein GDO86_011278 [Hymenochirus boettgeri]